MYPLQAVFLISILVIFPLAALAGGHAERAGATLYLCLYIVGYLVQHLQVDNLLWAEALVEIACLAGLLWLSLKRDRWWPLVASALQVMSILVYVATMLTPEFSIRSSVVATTTLSLLGLYCLLGGVLERFLAGEVAVSGTAIWIPVRKPPVGSNSGHQPP
jgi:cytochrome bd-type quinol oxidase subunit 2